MSDHGECWMRRDGEWRKITLWSESDCDLRCDDELVKTYDRTWDEVVVERAGDWCHEGDVWFFTPRFHDRLMSLATIDLSRKLPFELVLLVRSFLL